jgi:hypothetical protein
MLPQISINKLTASSKYNMVAVRISKYKTLMVVWPSDYIGIDKLAPHRNVKNCKGSQFGSFAWNTSIIKILFRWPMTGGCCVNLELQVFMTYKRMEGAAIFLG